MSPSRRNRASQTTTAIRCLLAAALLAPVLAAASPPIERSAVEQIRALHAEKEMRSPAQRKIASRLLVAIAQARGASWLAAMPQLRSALRPGSDGTYAVDLDGTIDAALLERVRALGGRVENAHLRFGAARLHVPLSAVEPLAAEPGVRSIRAAMPMMTQMINTSEGDIAHGAAAARITFGVDGTGVMACAMSDSVDALATLQASGDLPPVVSVLPGQSGNPATSEGTALLEILHDLAPGADLGFATGQGGQAQMAQNILDLAAAGCDVIVDDVLYLGEPVFQDGVIAQAVEQVVAQGVGFYSAAGNSGNFDKGTSGVYEGDYVATPLPAPLAGAGASAHDFGGGASGNEITFDPPLLVTLQWSDPFAAADNDYDLFLLDAAMANVLDFSTGVQDGDDDPLEAILSDVDDDVGNHLIIVKFAGLDRHLNLNSHRGQLDVATAGQIFGHPAAVGAMAVAAVDVATAGGGAFVGGAANPVEDFSSDGPRRIFFHANGTPVADSRAPEGSAQSSVVRQKPDLAAADGVTTATPGFNPFFGTSASAPHSAAIDALFQDLFPTLPVRNRYDIFRSSALDIEAPGFDRNSGDGIMAAEDALHMPIFADGFESGNTSAWTNSVP